ncbi:hypothetical protein L596_014828 [Steinernema carpocapsae]|uniref:Dendritic cell-specific transmembrane protein-like domain-containing protein n=1 Tax=Steinernema carpocapsae TaxID=34508 RepID=A0A4U5NDM0_STECR|nr:hypothetical protein L596_014828 [Steinernema carpocapsae]
MRKPRRVIAKSWFASILRKIFVEPYREARRRAKGRSLFDDVIWYSGVYDYRYLRLLYNLPIGFGLAYLLYFFSWARLNFVEFSPFLTHIFAGTLVSMCGLSYAFSPAFRAAVICLVLMSLGTNGQAVFSVFVFDAIRDGPVRNTISNVEASIGLIICNLEIQNEVLQAWRSDRSFPRTPGDENDGCWFSWHFFRSAIQKSKKNVEGLEDNMADFMEHYGEDEQENERLDVVNDNYIVLRNRAYLQTGFPPRKDKQPHWTQYKSNLARDIARKIEQHCIELELTTMRKCESSFGGLVRWCRRLTLGYMDKWCTSFKPLALCRFDDQESTIMKTCMEPLVQKDANGKLIFGGQFEFDAEELGDVMQEIKEQLKLGLRHKILTPERIEAVELFDEVTAKLRIYISTIYSFLNTLKVIMSSLLLLLIYQLFVNCMGMLHNYMTNVDFNNCYLTQYFYYIDETRKRMGKTSLLPLTTVEMKRFALKKPLSGPTNAELTSSWFALIRWFGLAVLTTLFIFMDYIIHKILTSVTELTLGTTSSSGGVSSRIRVEGSGFIAHTIKELLQYNANTSDSGTVHNNKCLRQYPIKKLSTDTIRDSIVVPLVFMLVLQVCETSVRTLNRI